MVGKKPMYHSERTGPTFGGTVSTADAQDGKSAFRRSYPKTAPVVYTITQTGIVNLSY